MNQLDYELGVLFVIMASASTLYNQFLVIRMIWVAMFFNLCFYGGFLAFVLLATIRLVGTPSQTKSRRVLTVPIIYLIRSKIAVVLSRKKRYQSLDNKKA